MIDSLADLNNRIDILRLNHGQAAIVIVGTNLAAGMAPSALHAMIRKLRRANVPFTEAESIKEDLRDELKYDFCQLVELALAVKLLNDGMAFRHVVSLVSKHRPILRQFYREALLEANSGRGTPQPMTMLAPLGTDRYTGEAIYERAAGLYLDFCAFQQNGVLTMSEPKLLGPMAAISRFMSLQDGLYPFPLIALSQICTRVEKIASSTPPVKRGPKVSIRCVPRLSSNLTSVGVLPVPGQEVFETALWQVCDTV